MASYKVPQNVEADDKLLGPFSFRQFIYLIVAVMGIAIGWALAQLFIPLAIIPLPVVVLFGALALPLRKDQPMEIYLAAVLSFILKPRKRLWIPDGKQSLVEIVAPRVVEVQRAKDLSQAEAEQRLSYLADIVDTQGWSVRGVSTPQPANAMTSDAFFEAQQAEDVLDATGGVAKSFDTMIGQADARRHEEMIERMRNPASAPTPAPQQQAVVIPPPPDPYASLGQPQADEPKLTYNPYPDAIHQSVVHPIGSQPAPAPQNQAPTTGTKPVSPDIINLANNSDLSIETIAHEAHRIKEKEESSNDGEVMISLR